MRPFFERHKDEPKIHTCGIGDYIAQFGDKEGEHVSHAPKVHTRHFSMSLNHHKGARIWAPHGLSERNIMYLGHFSTDAVYGELRLVKPVPRGDITIHCLQISPGWEEEKDSMYLHTLGPAPVIIRWDRSGFWGVFFSSIPITTEDPAGLFGIADFIPLDEPE